MSLSNIVLYFSILVWSTIPFRHAGKKYFYFFYFYALLDPLTLYLRILFHSGSNFFFIPIHFIMLISLFEKRLIIKYKSPLITILVILSLINFKINLLSFLLLLSLINLLILLKFFKEIISPSNINKGINIFLVFLFLNMITEILQYLGDYMGYLNGYFYFYLSLAFETLLGLFFWIFKEDNPKLLIKLYKN